MTRLVRVIHVFTVFKEGVGGPDKPGHDGFGECLSFSSSAVSIPSPQTPSPFFPFFVMTRFMRVIHVFAF
jgi:hypothetical protein